MRAAEGEQAVEVAEAEQVGQTVVVEQAEQVGQVVEVDLVVVDLIDLKSS